MNDQYLPPEASANMAGKCFLTSDSHIIWIVDSGASNHMTGSKHLLLPNGQVCSAGDVQLPTGDSAKISHIGNYPLSGGSLHWESEDDW